MYDNVYERINYLQVTFVNLCIAYSLRMSNVLSVRRHTLEILCMHKISERTWRTTTYASVL